MTLLDLQQGEKGYITKVRGRGAFRKRIMEMGFVVGKKVNVIKKAPLRDPIEYEVMGYNVSLRNHEARLIEVVSRREIETMKFRHFNGVIDDKTLKVNHHPKNRIINIALVGNPNCGKTTLFNSASGSRERVGNYTGVTVGAKKARFSHRGYLFNITDLPGTYSITSYTPEELYVRRHIIQDIPDVVVNVLDASNLERNLYLTTQLIDMDIKVVVALNMYDELVRRGDRFDHQSFAKMIGIPIIPTVSSRGKGLKELFDKIVDVFEDNDEIVRHIHINYGKIIEASIKKLQEKIKEAQNYGLTNVVAPRFLAIKLLEEDQDSIDMCAACSNHKEIMALVKEERRLIGEAYKEHSESVITDAKYGFISGALRETIRPGMTERRRRSDIIDTFFTHRIWGFPFFIFFLWLMFEATFTFGAYPMEWISQGVEGLGSLIGKHMEESILKDLLIGGIINGIGGVIVFLPNILILFFFISLMEDTGYMARAVFIMDKIMHKIGLHGRSFIPLIMGFGCTVPAIMATRTIENRNDRMITILINPFMSCSARLPVYVLLISAFFPEHPGFMLFAIYLTGIFIAVITAILLKKTIFKSDEVPFVMELPPYRMPTIKTTLRHMWDKGAEYLKKIGGVILIATIIIWALGYFPLQTETKKHHEKQLTELKKSYKSAIALASGPMEQKKLRKESKNSIQHLKNTQSSEIQENSYIGKIGFFMEPWIRPLGFDWRMGVSILSGVAAKEIVVSTMGVLYPSNDGKEKSLQDRLLEQEYNYGKKTGEKIFSPLVALAFMVFVLLYFPCIATISTISKESGSWKWGLFSIVYTTAMAWLMSLVVYQTGSLLL